MTWFVVTHMSPTLFGTYLYKKWLPVYLGFTFNWAPHVLPAHSLPRWGQETASSLGFRVFVSWVSLFFWASLHVWSVSCPHCGFLGQCSNQNQAQQPRYDPIWADWLLLLCILYSCSRQLTPHSLFSPSWLQPMNTLRVHSFNYSFNTYLLSHLLCAWHCAES